MSLNAISGTPEDRKQVKLRLSNTLPQVFRDTLMSQSIVLYPVRLTLIVEMLPAAHESRLEGWEIE
jgi:hypothetical protein